MLFHIIIYFLHPRISVIIYSLFWASPKYICLKWKDIIKKFTFLPSLFYIIHYIFTYFNFSPLFHYHLFSHTWIFYYYPFLKIFVIPLFTLIWGTEGVFASATTSFLHQIECNMLQLKFCLYTKSYTSYKCMSKILHSFITYCNLKIIDFNRTETTYDYIGEGDKPGKYIPSVRLRQKTINYPYINETDIWIKLAPIANLMKSRLLYLQTCIVVRSLFHIYFLGKIIS